MIKAGERNNMSEQGKPIESQKPQSGSANLITDPNKSKGDKKAKGPELTMLTKEQAEYELFGKKPNILASA